MALWQSEQHFLDHFGEHGRELGCRTVAEYDSSAQATLDTGVYFSYFDPGTGLDRLGCFDRATGKFVVLSEGDESIISHFSCSERYIRRLPYNNYDA